MPCRSDYMNPTEKEAESRLVAKLIVFIDRCKVKPSPEWIAKIANKQYGNPELLDKLTNTLCAELKHLTEEETNLIVYNGKNKQSRKLAKWKEKHDKLDTKREQTEKIAEAMDIVNDYIENGSYDRNHMIFHISNWLQKAAKK